ncbi:MAG: dihydropteridine reductase [Clostridia bacterium]|nr:dihydropteridine reductase [Clostridia bacterium]
MNTDKIYAEKIASEYAPKEDSKVKALKKLDGRAKIPANVFAYTFGIIAALIFGTGMCLSMKVIGDGTIIMMVVGIVIGVLGIVLMSINYPIYKRILENGKKKYASDIIELAKRISDEN